MTRERPFYVEIVPADRGWILETMARAIESAALASDRFDVSITDQPSDTADLVFFMPESAYQPQHHSITLTYFAHREAHSGAADLFDRVAQRTDHCVTSSSKYREVLKELGARSVYQIPLGVDTELFTPSLRLGVVGRTYQTGRKGEALLAAITDLPMLELTFTGAGWPNPSEFMPKEALAEFYRGLDYLLIPSEIEGGPVPLLEALASGCPVIAPSDIGMVSDFPHIPFARGDGGDLRRVVQGLLAEKQALRDSVDGCDWETFAQRHLEMFSEIISKAEEENRPPAARSNRLPAAPAKDGLRVLLVTHGSEDASRGGPTSRVRFIESQALSEGHHVAHVHNLTSTTQLRGFDSVHVLNSWPPQSALESMAVAKRSGKNVIFSPIALDLSEWPIYQQLLKATFASGELQTIKGVIRQLPSLSRAKNYGGPSPDLPLEGIPGHFEALRRCSAMADRLIFLSQHEQDFLSAIGARVDHGVIVPNGVTNIFDAAADPKPFRDFIGIDHFILSVGRLEYRKNQATLALAVADMGLPLVLIGGEGDAGYLEATKLLGGSNVIHVDHLSDTQLLSSAYAAASVFVLPSWSEGAPLAALEAGLAGTPLVLSDRSSEREYFGDCANYVAPGDTELMRQTIETVLARQDSQAERESRARRLRERYSQQQHVQATLAVYREACNESASTQPAVWLEVSALLHAIRVDTHLTGVPLSEWSLIKEIVQRYPAARCIVYNDIKDRFIEVAYRDLECFDASEFNARYWFCDDESDLPHDSRLVFHPEANVPSVLPDPVLRPSGASQDHPRGVVASVAQWLHRRGVPQPLIGRVGFLLAEIRRFKFRKPNSAESVEVNRHTNTAVDLTGDAATLFEVVHHPRTDVNIAPGSRILTLGQSWLSNEALLDRLITLSAGSFLEAYVYDISYVSGAHLSGWDDNEVRADRLTNLLSQCSTVFTESRTTEREINKFAAARSLNVDVVTTGLRGKSLERSTAGRSKSTPKQPFVLYVSSFNRRKNHDFIARVWTDLYRTEAVFRDDDIRLLLVGEIQGESKYGDPEFQSVLAENNIEVITDASDSLISDLYQDCLFTVYPSLQEGWGIPIQESLMSGKVCLASDTVPSALEIQNAAVVKLNPNDFFGWRESILSWATNARMRSAFEKRAADYSPPSWRDIANAVWSRQSHR